ncbi:hypothetical protein AeRB84_014234, partial [Aphanomyces euteiches]
MKVPDELSMLITHFSSGYKREIAQAKEDGTMRHSEGKSAISWTGYEFLCMKALLNDDREHSSLLSMHPFLVFCWNLMARSVSTASIRFEHVTWEGDCLIVQFERSKNDQEGNFSFPRHVYANPLRPALCPILSLAILVFTRGCPISSTSTLLFGPGAKDKFSKWLRRTCKEFGDEILSLGLSILEIGTHSFRKGVATALSNNPGGPQSVSIWLRAGWSLGNVQNIYIFVGSGGDQFVGRAATGLNVNEREFACLPPHFYGSALSSTEWEDILPGYRS